MKKLSINEAEALADKFRTHVGINLNEPINVKNIDAQAWRNYDVSSII